LLCVQKIAIAATSCWIDQFSRFEQRCCVCAGRAPICCARRATRSFEVEEFTVSHWTRVEFSSLIAREVRIGGLDARAAARADSRFEAMPDESLSFLLPSDDFSSAKRYIGASATGPLGRRN